MADKHAPKAWETHAYHWLHIPTGQRGVRTTAEALNRPMTRVEFLEWLAALNAQQPGNWQYWEHHQ